jgi:hypothetical protein
MENESRTDRPDTEIIPMSGGGSTSRKPIGILGAISQIQQFYVIESLGQDIPDEFLTLEGQLNYFNTGFSSGFIESLTFAVITALILPILADIQTANAVAQIFPLVKYRIFLYAVNCFPIVIFCGVCCFLAKYRVGKLTKKAVDNLLVGRLFSMAIKGVLIFVSFIFISNMINQTNAYKAAKIITILKKSYLPSVHRVIINLKPMLLTAAYEMAFIFAIAMLVPFFTIWLVSMYRKIHKKRVEQFWNIET